MITLDRATVREHSPTGDARTILRDVSLTITRGRWLAVIGPNGAGKSTLLSVLAALRPLGDGRRTLTGTGPEPRIGLVLQEPDNQLVTSTVYHELLLSLPAGVDDHSARHELLAAASARFDLDGFWDRNPHRLSGGEKQRLALATVYLQQPDLVLLDEPAAFLDPPSARRCREFAAAMRDRGAAVVWVGPGEDDVDGADDILCLEDGAVAFHGSAEAWEGWSGREDYRFPAPPAVAPAPDGEAAVAFDSVDFAYGRRPVFAGFDLAVTRGECLGVAGANGAGKSTLLHLAGGVVKPARGEVRLDFPQRRARRPVFFLPQSPERMFFAESVHEEVAFGLRRLGVGADEARRRTAAALAGVGLDAATVMSQQPFDLSYGEMRRVAFAVADVLEPSLVLLDEPTACLDPAGVALFYSILERYRAAGTTVIIASHDPRALAVCDRVVTIDASDCGR